jgi:hypothetical protein
MATRSRPRAVLATNAIAIIALYTFFGEPSGCLEADDCRRRVAAIAELESPTLREEELAGSYSRGGGLSGWDLHLFSDGTYRYCRFHRQKKRLKIGLYSPPAFGLAAARVAASAKLASITLGADPATTRGEARRAADVGELYEQFEREVVKRFPPKTRANWRCTSRRFLREIGTLPITATDEICDRVMALHKRIGFTEEKEALAHTVFKHACRFFRWAVNERRLKPTEYRGYPGRR